LPVAGLWLLAIGYCLNINVYLISKKPKANSQKPKKKKLSNKIIAFISFTWALCEATFFFVIPDVWLSMATVEGFKIGFKNVVISILGALLGGLVMYFWGKDDAQSAFMFIAKIPTHSNHMISTIEQLIVEDGLMGIFQGPIKGLPYKIFATFYGAYSYSLPLFLLVSIPARAMRFVLTVLVSHLISKYAMKNFSKKSKRLVLIFLWMVFYSFYLFR